MHSLIEEDGVSHINVYSQGVTKLGRMLSNFAHTPFNHPLFGHFESVEGFWYWLGTGQQHEELRALYGFEAKRVGRLYDRVPCEDFKLHVEDALFYKVAQNLDLQWLLIESNNDLPLVHYYSYGQGAKIVVPRDCEWILECLENLRRSYRFQYKTCSWVYD